MPEESHQFGDYSINAIAHLLNIPIISLRSSGPVALDVCSLRLWQNGKGLFYSSTKSKSHEDYLIDQQGIKPSDRVLGYSRSLLRDSQQHNLSVNDKFASLATGSTDSQASILDVHGQINALRKSFSSSQISKNSIVYYLHYEPEMVSCPGLYPQTDQLEHLAVVSYLCDLQGIDLYVREHPFQDSNINLYHPDQSHFSLATSYAFRSIDFYKQIIALPSFKGFVCSLDSSTLLNDDNLLAIATNTGTIVSEALSYQLPVILSSSTSTIYGLFPNVVKVGLDSTSLLSLCTKTRSLLGCYSPVDVFRLLLPFYSTSPVLNFQSYGVEPPPDFVLDDSIRCLADAISLSIQL